MRRWLLLGAITLACAVGIATMPLAQRRDQRLRATGHIVQTTAPVVTTTSAVQAGLPKLNLDKVAALKFDDLPATSNGQRMVAQVNGDAITVQEFEREFRTASVTEKNRDQEYLNALRSGLAQPTIDKLVEKKLIEQRARLLNIDVNEGEINRVIAAANANLPAGRKLQDFYISRGQPVQDLRLEKRDELLRKKVFDFVTDTVTTPTEEQLASFRKIYTARIRKTTETRAAHIVFRAIANDSTTNSEQARRNADTVLAELRSGLDFAEAALKYSQDRVTYNKGGDLGYFSPGKMYPEFDAVIARMQPGDISDVVKTPVGFHIIKVLEVNADDALQLYMADKKRKAFKDWQKQQLEHAVVNRYLK